jgi:hypothetical protein
MIPTFLILPRWSLRSFARQGLGCKSDGLTQGNQTVWFGIPDGPVFIPPDVGPAFLVLDHEDVEGGLWASLRLAPLILLPLAILQSFQLDHLWWSLLFYDDLLALG